MHLNKRKSKYKLKQIPKNIKTKVVGLMYYMAKIAESLLNSGKKRKECRTESKQSDCIQKNKETQIYIKHKFIVKT